MSVFSVRAYPKPVGAQNMPFGSSFGRVVRRKWEWGENGELPLGGLEGGVWASWILTHGRFFKEIC